MAHVSNAELQQCRVKHRWCHAPLTLFRGSTSYLSKKPGNHFNPVDDSMLPAPIVGCPRLMWAIALRACWYCRGSYYLAPGFTCGSFQRIPIQYWIHHSSPVFLSHLQSRNWRPFQVPLWLCQLWYRAVDSADSWGDLLSEFDMLWARILALWLDQDHTVTHCIKSNTSI